MCVDVQVTGRMLCWRSDEANGYNNDSGNRTVVQTEPTRFQLMSGHRRVNRVSSPRILLYSVFFIVGILVEPISKIAIASTTAKTVDKSFGRFQLNF